MDLRCAAASLAAAHRSIIGRPAFLHSMRYPTISLSMGVLALALTACQQPADDNIAIDESNAAASADVDVLPPSDSSGAPVETGEGLSNEIGDGDSPDGNSAEPSPPASNAVIPAQYRGRWGMVAADCTSTRGDAKGLMTIGDKTIRFFEAVATLKEQRPAISTSFSGQFAFTGEGQNWEKVMTFTRTGDTLKRAEDEGTYSYRRCS